MRGSSCAASRREIHTAVLRLGGFLYSSKYLLNERKISYNLVQTFVLT